MEARADRNRAQTESNLESEATEPSQLRPQRRVRRRLMQVNSSSEDEGNAADTYSVLSPPPPPPQEQLYEPLCKYYNNFGGLPSLQRYNFGSALNV